MKIQVALVSAISAIAALGISLPAHADTDTRNAFCKYFLHGSTIAQASMPCKVSSDVEVLDATIVWQDGVRQTFRNYGGASFVYVDNLGGQVYKRLGLFDPSGKIDVESDRAYKMENGTVYIWWRR